MNNAQLYLKYNRETESGPYTVPFGDREYYPVLAETHGTYLVDTMKGPWHVVKLPSLGGIWQPVYLIDGVEVPAL